MLPSRSGDAWNPKSGWTPLHQSAKDGYVPRMKQTLDLARRGPDDDGFGDVYRHAGTPSQKKMQLIRDRAYKNRIELPTRGGDRALHIAFRNGHAAAARELLAAGADPSSRGFQGETALHVCARRGMVSEMDNLITNHGLDVNAVTESGATCAHLAATEDRSDTLRFLDTVGCSFSIRDSIADETPLHYAAKAGSSGAVLWLLDRDPTLLRQLNSSGKDAESLARDAGRYETSRLLEAARKEASEQINKARRAPVETLRFAREGNVTGLRQVLMNAPEGTVDTRTKGGSNPFLEAVASGSVEAVKFLFGLPGTRLTMNDRTGATALHIAAGAGHLKVLKFLLEEMGEDPTRADAAGSTPVEAAHRARHLEIVKLLQAHEESMLRDRVSATRAPSTPEPTPKIQTPASQDLTDFLTDLDLKQWIAKFAEEGFDTLARATRVMESDLIKWGAPPGHRRILLEALAEMRRKKPIGAHTPVRSPSANQFQPFQPSVSMDHLSTGLGQLSVSRLPERCASAPALTREESGLSDRFVLRRDELKIEDEILGEGSFGVVRRAMWRGIRVAVKELRLGAGPALMKQASEPDSVSAADSEELMREAAVMARVCHHKNIVPFVGVILEPSACIVTALMPYGSVEDLLVTHANRPNPRSIRRELEKTGQLWATAIGFLRDAANGVKHLHSQGVIHRDLAARNLLVDEQRSVRVADFGFARVKDAHKSKGYTNSTIGAIAWLAPEAIRSRFYSEASDVFSFGVTAYEVILGRPPWEGYESLDALVRVCAGQRMELPSHMIGLPDGVLEMMPQAWRHEPDTRPTLDVLLAQLNGWMAFLVPPSPKELQRSHSKSGPSNNFREGAEPSSDNETDRNNGQHRGNEAVERYQNFIIDTLHFGFVSAASSRTLNNMGPRFYCDYCDMYLTHETARARREHRYGWKHRENFQMYYENLMRQKKEQETRRFFEERGIPLPPPNLPPPQIPAVPPPFQPTSYASSSAPAGAMYQPRHDRSQPPRSRHQSHRGSSDGAYPPPPSSGGFGSSRAYNTGTTNYASSSSWSGPRR